MEPLRFEVWYDYLCPWCYSGGVRMERVRDRFPGQVELVWKSYLLRPAARGSRDLERFRAYTRSWLRPGAEPDAPAFRVWEGDAPPPSHSVPPHRVARAAREIGAFDAIHGRLLRAYFQENRDISDEAVLEAIWKEAGLPAEAFARAWEDDVLSDVLREHDAAMEAGVTGVPAVRLQGNDALIVGAQPLELYERWVQRSLAAKDGGGA